MPLIRKSRYTFSLEKTSPDLGTLETSNRKSTNYRRKIINKVREGRKKKVKAAKKNPQWKSSKAFLQHTMH